MKNAFFILWKKHRVDFLASPIAEKEKRGRSEASRTRPAPPSQGRLDAPPRAPRTEPCSRLGRTVGRALRPSATWARGATQRGPPTEGRMGPSEARSWGVLLTRLNDPEAAGRPPKLGGGGGAGAWSQRCSRAAMVLPAGGSLLTMRPSIVSVCLCRQDTLWGRAHVSGPRSWASLSQRRSRSCHELSREAADPAVGPEQGERVFSHLEFSVQTIAGAGESRIVKEVYGVRCLICLNLI